MMAMEMDWRLMLAPHTPRLAQISILGAIFSITLENQSLLFSYFELECYRYQKQGKEGGVGDKGLNAR